MEEQFLNDIGEFLVEQIRKEILTPRDRFSLSPRSPKGKYNANATGTLYKSVEYVVRDGEIDIIMEDYGAEYLFGKGSWPSPVGARGKTSALITSLTKWAQKKPGLMLPLAEARSMAFAVRKNLFKSGYAPIPLFDTDFQDAITDKATSLLANPEYAEALANGLLDNIFDRINLFGKETYNIQFG
jgi:hypothetical protein